MGRAVSGPVDDPRLLRMAPTDNVVLARAPIERGTVLLVSGTEITTATEVPVGFKLAAEDLAAGTTIFRSTVPIGRLTVDVRRGELVHVHNLESLYLRTHARGES